MVKVVEDERGFSNKILIVTIIPVFTDPGITVPLNGDMLMVGQNIMQHLFRCYANGKNT